MHTVDTAARATAPQSTQKATFDLGLHFRLGFVVRCGRVGERVLRRVGRMRGFGEVHMQCIDVGEAVRRQWGKLLVALGQGLQHGAGGMHRRAAARFDIGAGSSSTCRTDCIRSSSRGGGGRGNVTRRARRSSRSHSVGDHGRHVCVMSFFLRSGITVGADQGGVFLTGKRQTGLRIGAYPFPFSGAVIVFQNRCPRAGWYVAGVENRCLGGACVGFMARRFVDNVAAMVGRDRATDGFHGLSKLHEFFPSLGVRALGAAAGDRGSRTRYIGAARQIVLTVKFNKAQNLW